MVAVSVLPGAIQLPLTVAEIVGAVKMLTVALSETTPASELQVIVYVLVPLTGAETFN